MRWLVRGALGVAAALLCGCAVAALPAAVAAGAAAAAGDPVPSEAGRAAKKGELSLSVRWPPRQAQLLPLSAERVDFDLMREQTLVATASALRPAGTGASTASLVVDAGAYTVAARARSGPGLAVTVATASLPVTVAPSVRTSVTLTLAPAYRPVVTGLTPAAGRTGDTLTLSGSNLGLTWAATPTVTFSGDGASVSAPVTSYASEAATVTVPPWARGGAVEIVVDGVAANAGTYAPLPSLFTSYFCATYDLTNAANDTTSRANTGNPERHLAALFASAASTIDVALYELDEPSLVAALVAAKLRGVTVRAVAEKDNAFDASGNATSGFADLAAAGIPIVPDTRTSALMHNKFVVVDAAKAWTGSFNLTVNGAFRQNNNAISIANAALAANFGSQFTQMFANNKFGSSKTAGVPNPAVAIEGATVSTLFSPKDQIAARIVSEINEARSGIKFMAFSFTSSAIGDAILARAAAGVAVEGVIENTGASGTSGQYPRFAAAGLDVRRDGNPSFMHHKVMVIDSATVITGSYNFTGGAETNDENVLIFENAPELAATYAAEFARVKATAIAAGN
ncbi:MAG: IPT/TIG domain-containing protein [Candidatus Sericytochromatia bacterium]|nr:IPT/TIG domain-containing protein [Candidatus Tanganyikabacteria bacterium]